ncbi:hypothetical protein [Draconibacterium orientale]|uniref:hypothetical protein n=1 Tax=Draconibacterium orientale TaxID=1168034 RepID=UPI002A0A6852|nr:hypothetical protein [Draconibacterium orientale]
MLNINKSYVTDKNKRLIAVQIDIKTFEKIEQVLEDHALGKLIEENIASENLTLNDAKAYYKNLRK